MNKKLSPFTVAHIYAYKLSNPSDSTDFTPVITFLQNLVKSKFHKTSIPAACPCCAIPPTTPGGSYGASTGLMKDGTICHICDGSGVISDLSKVSKSWVKLP